MGKKITNMTEYYSALLALEGLKEQVDQGQVRELVKCEAQLEILHPEVIDLRVKYRKGVLKRMKAAK